MLNQKQLKKLQRTLNAKKDVVSTFLDETERLDGEIFRLDQVDLNLSKEIGGVEQSVQRVARSLEVFKDSYDLGALKGEKGDPGKDGAPGRDGKDGQDGHTPQKGVDYFDGEDGYTPIKGIDYFDGKDGYTPIKGVDYFDGKDGAPGMVGPMPKHKWEGTKLSFENPDGTFSKPVDLLGQTGFSQTAGGGAPRASILSQGILTVSEFRKLNFSSDFTVTKEAEGVGTISLAAGGGTDFIKKDGTTTTTALIPFALGASFDDHIYLDFGKSIFDSGAENFITLSDSGNIVISTPNILQIAGQTEFSNPVSFPSASLTNTSNQLEFGTGSTGTLSWGVTTNQTVTIPDATGTLPLLESTQSWTGGNTFGNTTEFNNTATFTGNFRLYRNSTLAAIMNKASGTGRVLTITGNATGSGYVVGDVLTISGGGGSGATIYVASINGSGGVTGGTLIANGDDYAVTTGAATTGGTGSGATFNITAVSDDFEYDSTNGCFGFGVGSITTTRFIDINSPNKAVVLNLTRTLSNRATTTRGINLIDTLSWRGAGVALGVASPRAAMFQLTDSRTVDSTAASDAIFGIDFTLNRGSSFTNSAVQSNFKRVFNTSLTDQGTYSRSGAQSLTTNYLSAAITENPTVNIGANTFTHNLTMMAFAGSMTPTVTTGTYVGTMTGVDISIAGTTTGTTLAFAYYVNNTTFDTMWAFWNDTADNHLYMGGDNAKTYFGTGSNSLGSKTGAIGDASIYYDGTNLVINSDDVGSGACNINGLLITNGGYLQPISSTDAAAPNNSVYYSTTASKLVYKDAGGAVNNLY